jgi:3-deoxy-D-manno-octulosonic-acid transferase
MSITSSAYSLAVRALRALSPLAERGGSKVALGIRGRRDALEVLEEWSRSYRDPEQSLIWLHAPSVGEGLQARASLEALLGERDNLQAAYTFFSPSALNLARKMPVHVAGYLPWDVEGELGGLVDLMRPSLIAFTKTEVWPGLARAARARGIPVALIAATLPENAGRLRLSGRLLLGSTFRGLSAVLAVTDDDARRFTRLGVPEERIRVTGDPAIDSAWARARELDVAAPYLAPFRRDPSPTLVAGSTWGADEDVLVPALARIRKEVPELRSILAPHEPGEEHLAALERRLDGAGLSSVRLARVEEEGQVGAAVVVVDRVGVLAHLYTVGTVGYVGGGFHRHGLHSVLEPAAAGLPVVWGPRFANSWAAEELIRVGGGVSAKDGKELARVLQRWFTDEGVREEAARRASEYIESHRGAAGRTARAILHLLPGPGPVREVSPDGPDQGNEGS